MLTFLFRNQILCCKNTSIGAGFGHFKLSIRTIFVIDFNPTFIGFIPILIQGSFQFYGNGLA